MTPLERARRTDETALARYRAVPSTKNEERTNDAPGALNEITYADLGSFPARAERAPEAFGGNDGFSDGFDHSDEIREMNRRRAAGRRIE